jgi:GMP synthase-like glutamine amidotransferase
MTLAAWHQDQVLTPPKGAQTIAKHENCAHAALLYPGWGLSFQPHPEFSPSYLEGLLLARGPGIVPDTLLSNAKHRLKDHLDAKPVADKIAQFFRDNASVPTTKTETI